MNKKLIALAVATLPAAAMADVTIYGAIKGGVEHVKTYTATSSTSVNNVDDLGSRIGFKGQEDLGNGLKAIWQVENRVVIDGTGTGTQNTFASRDAFIGLSNSSFGTVRLGRLSNYSNSDMGIIDTWEYNAYSLGLGQLLRGDRRINNAIRYDSPVFAGFDFTYLRGFDETAGVRNDVDNIGVGYSNGPVTAKYSFDRQKVGTSTKADKNHRAEATVTFGNFLLGAGYAYTTNYTGAAGATKTNMRDAALTVNYSMGALTPKLSYAHGWDVRVNDSKVANSSYNQVVVGVDYALSKRTIAGATYGTFNTKTGAAGNPLAKQRGLGVQLVHKF